MGKCRRYRESKKGRCTYFIRKYDRVWEMIIDKEGKLMEKKDERLERS